MPDNSDISKNTHCLPQDANPHQGRGSNCSDLLLKRQLGVKNDTQNFQLRDHLHNRIINQQVGEQRLNRSIPPSITWIHQHASPTAPIADHSQIIIQ